MGTSGMTTHSVAELVATIKHGAMGSGGKCNLMIQVDRLPDAHREAISLTMPDKSVTHQQIHSFIRYAVAEFLPDEKIIGHSAVTRHRNWRHGCAQCGDWPNTPIDQETL